nr:hypothetical protein [Actibacterium sp. 188UL27-1]
METAPHDPKGQSAFIQDRDQGPPPTKADLGEAFGHENWARRASSRQQAMSINLPRRVPATQQPLKRHTSPFNRFRHGGVVADIHHDPLAVQTKEKINILATGSTECGAETFFTNAVICHVQQDIAGKAGFDDVTVSVWNIGMKAVAAHPIRGITGINGMGRPKDHRDGFGLKCGQMLTDPIRFCEFVIINEQQDRVAGCA